MPKAERGTPKDIANRMKAKGLQKLKFYCQMCSKQCRDENGFKCHLTSDSHLRQMKMFAENSSGIMDEFSREFEEGYLETLRRRHGTKRMNANNVYQEVIQDKHHIHMNSTKWATLTDFVQYLGKAGKCVVDETERGWYVTYIERDPALLARQEAHRKRVEAEKAEEVKAVKRMEKQRAEAAAALDRAGGTMHVEASKMKRNEGEGLVAMSIANRAVGGSKKKRVGDAGIKSAFGDDGDDGGEEFQEEEKRIRESGGFDKDRSACPAVVDDESRSRKRSRWGGKEEKFDESPTVHASTSKRPKHNDNDFQRNVDINRDRRSSRDGRSEKDVDGKRSRDIRKENWLHRDIIVRIISKKLAKGAYYKRKGIVDRVVEKFAAEVEIMDSGPDERDGGDVIRIDQDDLETVMPREGKKVRILNGCGRGEVAEVLELDKRKYQGILKIAKTGEVLKKVDYEDFSKMA
uniref:C2H2-type domain-containing protein n=2 Tax=Odontella aurita TaxID=265563 RepID=A0A7S4IJY5_9STRA|mmetsp:Transcript_26249/g.77616  ORF Transcript_26249/g.77616 Transcript_26249/m.77616 type:complete len:462 (+) Transcript_26249:177-1562(+)